MSRKERVQWLLVYLVPYVLVGIITFGAGLVMLPLGGTLGVFVGLTSLTSTAPYFTIGYKAFIFVACLGSILLFLFGYKKREKIWGKIINASGVYLWYIVGLVGFRPQ